MYLLIFELRASYNICKNGTDKILNSCVGEKALFNSANVNSLDKMFLTS